jgi:hypothetical protein
MRRNVLNALVALGAFWLGVFSLYQGRLWFGMCFIALGILRALLQFRGRKPAKPEPAVRLNIDSDKAGLDD